MPSVTAIGVGATARFRQRSRHLLRFLSRRAMTQARPERIALRGRSVRMTFDETGFTFVPITSREHRVHWTELKFVSVTPAVLRTEDDGWVVKPNPYADGAHLRALGPAGWMEFKFVVNDRRPIIARAGNWWHRLFVAGTFKAMLDSEGCRQPDESVMTVNVRGMGVPRPGGLVCGELDCAMGDFLDFLERHSRFGLVVGF